MFELIQLSLRNETYQIVRTSFLIIYRFHTSLHSLFPAYNSINHGVLGITYITCYFVDFNEDGQMEGAVLCKR